MKNINNSKLRIIPLGGLEQIGMAMAGAARLGGEA